MSAVLPFEREEPDLDAGGALGFIRRRLAGAYTVDPWGLDRDVRQVAARLARLRWSASVEGVPLPASGPVLLVANARLASLAPLAAVLALGDRAGRLVRFAGIVDVEPVATASRRLGGVIGRPAEVAGVLRTGEVALVWCRSVVRSNPPRVGWVAPELLLPAVEQQTAVMPVAISGGRVGRHLRVEVGAPLRIRQQPSPLAAAELADVARAAVQALLDEHA
jgi:hypothetical protein